jgi:hypothetical protein
MASATASRSSMGRRAQTCGLATSRMVAPPCYAYSLEGRNQLFNGNWREDGRFGAGFRRQIRAADGDETDLARQDFNLTVTDVSRKSSESRELQRPAVEGMTRIGDSDLALAFFRDQRGITLGEVSLCRGCRQGNNCSSVQSTRNAPAPGPSAWTGPAGP